MLRLIGEDGKGKKHTFASSNNYKQLKRQAKDLRKQNTPGILSFKIEGR